MAVQVSGGHGEARRLSFPLPAGLRGLFLLRVRRSGFLRYRGNLTGAWRGMLSRWRHQMMTLACRLCGLRKSFDPAAVMRQFGEDYNITRLRHPRAMRATGQ
jgi:hypothetical protein